VDEEEIGMEVEGLDECSGELMFFFFNLGMNVVFSDKKKKREREEDEDKGKTVISRVGWPISRATSSN